MMVTDMSPCPACGDHTLHKHCGEGSSCGWLRCRNKACRATLDPRRGRGNKQISDSEFEHFRFTA